MTYLKSKNDVRGLIILDSPFHARTLLLFYKLGCLPLNHIGTERRLILSYWSNHVTNLKKKLLNRFSVLARIK